VPSLARLGSRVNKMSFSLIRTLEAFSKELVPFIPQVSEEVLNQFSSRLPELPVPSEDKRTHQISTSHIAAIAS